MWARKPNYDHCDADTSQPWFPPVTLFLTEPSSGIVDSEQTREEEISRIIHQTSSVNKFLIKTEEEQDPASTMQKTGWTIHSFFLVLSGLKKSFTLDVITKGQSTTISLCIGPFSAWWRTTKRTPGWSKSKPALDQCEKTVFCKKCVRAHTLINNIFFTFFRGVTRFLNVGFSGTLCLHSDFNLS